MSSWLDYLNWTGGNGFLFYFTSLILGMALVEGDGLERKVGRKEGIPYLDSSGICLLFT